jgi:hypothetical protein
LSTRYNSFLPPLSILGKNLIFLCKSHSSDEKPTLFTHCRSVFGAIVCSKLLLGVKGGLAVGQQRWDEQGSAQNSLLFAPQGDLFYESAPEEANSVIFASAGYHVRGSALRSRGGVGVDLNGQPIQFKGFTQRFMFNNAALTLGVKRRGVLGKERAYYAVGLRGEYTLGTNLEDGASGSPYAIFFLTKTYVRKFNGGLSLFGGYEIPFGDMVGAFIEVGIHPDVTRQYFQPPIAGLNFRDPYSGETIRSIPQRSIRNLSFEVTLGFKFLRKVIYLD